MHIAAERHAAAAEAVVKHLQQHRDCHPDTCVQRQMLDADMTIAEVAFR